MSGFLIEAKRKDSKNDWKCYLIQKKTLPTGKVQNYCGWHKHTDYKSSYTEDYANELLHTKRIFDYEKYTDFRVVPIARG